MIGYSLAIKHGFLPILASVLDKIALGLTFIGLCVINVIAAYGFSQISNLLIYPFYENIMEQHSLESALISINNNIKNISYQYTYRGLNPPKQIKLALNVLNIEKEDIEGKIMKSCKRDLKWWLESSISVFCGCLGIVLSLAIISGLLVVLIEQAILSECKWSCGFAAFTRTNQLLSEVTEALPMIYMLCALVYLFNLCTGIRSILPLVGPSVTTSNDLIAIVLILSLANYTAPLFLHQLFPLISKSETLPLVSYFSHWALCSIAFLLSIYWNCFKCKDRSKL